jgi:hypothetical protein
VPITGRASAKSYGIHRRYCPRLPGLVSPKRCILARWRPSGLQIQRQLSRREKVHWQASKEGILGIAATNLMSHIVYCGVDKLVEEVIEEALGDAVMPDKYSESLLIRSIMRSKLCVQADFR